MRHAEAGARMRLDAYAEHSSFVPKFTCTKTELLRRGTEHSMPNCALLAFYMSTSTRFGIGMRMALAHVVMLHTS